ARAAISGSRPRRNRSIKDRAAPSDRSPCALGFLARRRRGLSPPPRRWRGFREARGGALRLRRLARARRALRSAPRRALGRERTRGTRAPARPPGARLRRAPRRRGARRGLPARRARRRGAPPPP